MAGLSCARMLHDGGLKVQVFEKSRGLGGRIATRRVDGLQFDHGAQYITARSPRLSTYLASTREEGAAAIWSPRSGNSENLDWNNGDDWAVGLPGMSGLVRPLAAGLDIAHGVQIQSLERAAPGWTLIDQTSNRFGPFDAVVVTAPAPQTIALLTPRDPSFEALSEVTIAPCWAGLFAFETSTNCAFDALRKAEGAIAWIARDSSKPGRGNQPETWVIHASANWSRQNLEHDKHEIAKRLLDEFKDVSGLADLPTPVLADAHRWRYALVETPLGQPFIQSADMGLFAAGDWCLAPRVEAAYESGAATADAILRSSTK